LGEEQRDRVKFVFISVPTRSGVDQYQELRQRVEHRVGRINGQYATLHNSPVHFMHRSVGFTELCALYSLADVALVTPLTDGMNLVAKEFVACQRGVSPCAAVPDRSERGPGVLILSEFAGAAQEFPNAVTVNPYDVPAIADAIAQALAMPAEERRRRIRPMRERVFTYDAAAWARDFIGDLAQRPPCRPCDSNGVARARGELAAAVAAAKRVALFLDYDGTLREIVRDPAAATPTPELRRLLDRLAALEALDVTIVSGRTARDLESFLGDYGAFGLVAEHGAEVRPPHSGAWQHLDHNLDFGWKEQVRHILALFQRSTPGTHIEHKRTGLVWHYRRADPEFGKWKANQLVDELSMIAANSPIEVRHGRKIVEATSAHISKGAAVTRLLAGGAYDLVLLAGDDVTDESMFQLAEHDPRLITIRIGDGDTRAQHRLPSPAAFRQFLESALA
jgi:trehalose 6-phosphate synthase/phosphatase